MAIALVLLVLFVLALGIWTVERGIGPGDATFYGSFIQPCYSSWPSNLPFDRRSWWFVFGVSSRIVLIFGSFAGVVAILESMIRQRRLPMKYADVLALRDNTIRDILTARLPMSDEQKQVFAGLFDNAVEAANKDVELQLREIFGKDSELILQRKAATEQSTL